MYLISMAAVLILWKKVRCKGMANTDLRMEIMKRGLKNYQVASFVGVTETTFSKWLRTELPPEKKQDILKAINENCEK